MFRLLIFKVLPDRRINNISLNRIYIKLPKRGKEICAKKEEKINNSFIYLNLLNFGSVLFI